MSPAPSPVELAALPAVDLDFARLAPTARRVPPAPRFQFGPVCAEVSAHYFTQGTVPAGGVYTARGLTLEDFHLLRHRGTPLLVAALRIHRHHVDDALRRAVPDLPVRRLPGRHVLLAGPGALVYGHWLADYLPKLGLLAAAGHDVDALSYLLPEPLAPFARDWLGLLGIGPARITSYRPGAEAVAPDELLLPTVLHNGTRASPLLAPALAFLRGRLARTTLRPAEGKGRLLFSRSGAGQGRRLVNRGAVEAMAEQVGFAVFSPERLPLADQVRMLLGAREIIGEYGSALHACIVAPAGTVVAGLRGDAVQPGFIQSAIGEALGQPTGYVYGSMVETDAGNSMRFSFEIAPGDFHACLGGVFGGGAL